jgi:hypothetical protein
MGYLRAVWKGITWRRVLIVQTLGQTAAFLASFEWGFFGDYIGHPSAHFASMGLYLLMLLPLALAADEAIRRGARARYVYSGLLVGNAIIACAAAGATQALYCTWWTVPWPAKKWGFTEAGLHMSVYSALGLVAFINRRITDRTLEFVRGAELRRVQLDRQLIESRLATAEAQIDPQMLFGALARIKHGFEAGDPEAERNLNELIQTLRTALARTATARLQVE